MKVGHLHSRLSARGGAHRHLIAVLGRLQGRADTILAVGQDDGSLPPEEKAVIGPWLRVKGLSRRGLSARGGAAAIRRLEELLAAQSPDLVHVHNIMDPLLLETAARAAPALITVQDHRFFCPGLGKLFPDGALCGKPLGEHCLGCFKDAAYGRRMLELTSRRLKALAGFGAVLVLSGYMAAELAHTGRNTGLDPARVEVLPPFVQGLPPGLPRGPGTYHLFAGRLVERKGVIAALEAARDLDPAVPLVVAGDGPLSGEAALAADESGGRIRFAGWQDRAGMAGLLSGALSLWLPSLWAEPFGIAGLEALYQGVPVIASKVGGVADWLEPGVNGLLVPPGDAAALARAAAELSAEPERAWAMGRRGAKMIRERFAPGPLMERLLEVYCRVRTG
jgi:glycosyltransferase involved in cell wall biosynthesis